MNERPAPNSLKRPMITGEYTDLQKEMLQLVEIQRHYERERKDKEILDGICDPISKARLDILRLI